MNVFFVQTVDGVAFVSMCIICESIDDCIEIINNNLVDAAFGYDEILTDDDVHFGNDNISITKMNLEKEDVAVATISHSLE